MSLEEKIMTGPNRDNSLIQSMEVTPASMQLAMVSITLVFWLISHTLLELARRFVYSKPIGKRLVSYFMAATVNQKFVFLYICLLVHKTYHCEYKK